jgi:purine-binding chemotaxis protein CheW
VALASGRIMMGIVVDAVSEVLNIAAEDIEQTPDFGERVETDYMKGIAKVKGKVKILLDLDRVLGADGVLAVRAA